MHVTYNYALIMPETTIPSLPSPLGMSPLNETSICHLFYVTKFGLYVLFLQSVSPDRHQMLYFASLGVRKWGPSGVGSSPPLI